MNPKGSNIYRLNEIQKIRPLRGLKNIGVIKFNKYIIPSG